MEEYKGNSHKLREEASNQEHKVEKIVSGKVKKKGSFQKIRSALISEDAESVKSYIFIDVLIPAIKKAISDIVTNGIEMMLYGDSGRKRGTSSKISYRDYYKDDSRIRDRRAVNGIYDYDDIIIPSRGEAEEVLRTMDEIIDTYGMVSVADFYELVGVTGRFTDNKYGWTDLRTANVIHVRDGYMIRLPKAKVL